MTTGFQQQNRSVNVSIPKRAPMPHQVGRKIESKSDSEAQAPRPPEPRSFK